MRNRRLKAVACFGVSMLLMLSVAFAQDTDDPAKLLQQGLFEEEANQNLEAAIESYEAVVRHVDEQRRLSATAIFRLGECYRKLGRNEDAAEQYRRVVNQFADQETLARLSRQNLQALGIDVSDSKPGEGVIASAPSNLTPEGRTKMRALIEERIAILEEEEARLKRQFESGVVSRDAFLPVQREIFDLNRDLIRLDEAAGTAETESGVGAATASAEDEKIRELQKMIENSPDLINGAPSEGMPPLHEAAEKGQLKVAKFLVEHGAKVNLLANGTASSSNGSTPLHIAVMNGHNAMAEMLLEAGANPEIRRNDGSSRTALGIAAMKGFSTVAKTLLQHGADPNARDGVRGSTPLQEAVYYRRPEVVNLLIKYGADVHAVKTGAWPTPLGIAAQKNLPEIAQVLLNAGADPNQDYKTGSPFKTETPLFDAIGSGSLEIVEMLVKAGANVNAHDDDGNTPLLRAAYSGSPEIVKMLVQAGADVNARGKIGRTAVFRAVESQRADILKILLAAEPELDLRADGSFPLKARIQKTMGDPTALMRAVKSRYENKSVDLDIIRMLLEAGANPNLADKTHGETPLFWALEAGDTELTALLLEHGADPNVTNSSGQTPLSMLQLDLSLLEIPEGGDSATRRVAAAQRNRRVPAPSKETLEKLRSLLKEHGAH